MPTDTIDYRPVLAEAERQRALVERGVDALHALINAGVLPVRPAPLVTRSHAEYLQRLRATHPEGTSPDD